MNRLYGFTGLMVLVGGALCAQAGPGNGIRVAGDTVIVSPFAGVGVTHESNVLFSTNEVDDIFYDLTAGIDIKASAAWGTASLRAWFQDRNYDDTTDRNSENIGQSFAASFGDADSLEARLTQRYSKTTDYTFNERDVGLTPMDQQAYDLPLLEGVALAAEKEEQRYGVDLHRAFQKLDVTLGAAYSSVGYEDGAIGDWDEVAGRASAEYDLSAKVAAVLDLEAAQQDSDVIMDSAKVARARVGVRYAATAKVDVRATVGYMQSDAGETADGTALEKRGIDYELAGAWQAARKVTVQVEASSGIIPSEIYSDNIKRLDQASASLLFDLTDRFDASLSALVRQDTYEAAIGNEGSPSQNTVGGIATLTYEAPGDFLTVALRARYDTFNSNFEDDFDVTRVSLAANFRY